jgi:hypothetical protein
MGLGSSTNIGITAPLMTYVFDFMLQKYFFSSHHILFASVIPTIQTALLAMHMSAFYLSENTFQSSMNKVTQTRRKLSNNDP